MKKNILVSILLLPIICLACWFLFLTCSQIGTKEVRLYITGYDPRDLLAGRYLAYQIDWEKTDCTQFENNICPKEEFCKEARWGRQCRFYLSELNASLFESMLRQQVKTFEVIYAYKKGRLPIAKRLLIDGEDFKKVLKKTYTDKKA